MFWSLLAQLQTRLPQDRFMSGWPQTPRVPLRRRFLPRDPACFLLILTACTWLTLTNYLIQVILQCCYIDKQDVLERTRDINSDCSPQCQAIELFHDEIHHLCVLVFNEYETCWLINKWSTYLDRNSDLLQVVLHTVYLPYLHVHTHQNITSFEVVCAYEWPNHSPSVWLFCSVYL